LLPSFEGNFLTQGTKFCHKKTQDLEAAHGEDFVILACIIFIQCQGVTDGRTDRRTDDDGCDVQRILL